MGLKGAPPLRARITGLDVVMLFVYLELLLLLLFCFRFWCFETGILFVALAALKLILINQPDLKLGDLPASASQGIFSQAGIKGLLPPLARLRSVLLIISE